MMSTRVRATTTAVLLPICLLAAGLGASAASGRSERHIWIWAACLGQAIGGLIAGAAIVALGPGLRRVRWPSGMIVAALSCLALPIRAQRAYLPDRDIAVLVLSIPVMFCAALVPFLMLRLWRGWRISLPSPANENAAPGARFGIATLMTVTAGVALCLTFTQIGYRFAMGLDFSKGTDTEGYLSFLLAQAIAGLVIAMYGVLIGLPSLWALLGTRIALWRLAVVGICAATFTVLLAWAISSMLRIPFSSAAPTTYQTLLYLTIPLHAGMAATTTVLAIAARSAGFRLAG
ncbi:MAG: hypothetical protein WD873_05985 [Candidatus Hydrogenedentales bacterium]